MPDEVAAGCAGPARGDQRVGRSRVELLIDYWVFVAGPILGRAVGVAVAFVIGGPGGGMSGSAAAEGALYTEAQSGNRT